MWKLACISGHGTLPNASRSARDVERRRARPRRHDAGVIEVDRRGERDAATRRARETPRRSSSRACRRGSSRARARFRSAGSARRAARRGRGNGRRCRPTSGSDLRRSACPSRCSRLVKPRATSHSISEAGPAPRSSTYQRLISDGTSRIGVAISRHAPAAELAAGATCSRVHATCAASGRPAARPCGARRHSAASESSGDLASAPVTRRAPRSRAQPLVDGLAPQLERRRQRAVLDGERRVGEEWRLIVS